MDGYSIVNERDEPGYMPLCGICWKPATTRATWHDSSEPYFYCDSDAAGMRVAGGDDVTMVSLTEPARMVVVVGPDTIGMPSVPTILVAATMRLSRATPGGYGYPDYVRRGWRMRVWLTPASRERFRLDAVGDL